MSPNHRFEQHEQEVQPAAFNSSQSIQNDDFFRSSCPASFRQKALRRYCFPSRRHTSKIDGRDLPWEKSERGTFTPAGIFFKVVKLTVPLAYSYIAAYVIRDLALKTDTLDYVLAVPILCNVINRIALLPVIVHIWAIIEAVFYVCLQLHLQWLQFQCPLEASLRCAPFLEAAERQELFQRILECERDDPVSFLRGWFFDAPLESISRCDMLDFMAWCLFEGRSREHLREEEVDQLDGFVQDLELKISFHLHGAVEDLLEDICLEENDPSSPLTNETERTRRGKVVPRNRFVFHVNKSDTSPTFFSNLYENYKQMYENYKGVLENDRLQNLRNFVNEKRQQLVEAEESALAAASSMYENCKTVTDERMQDFRKFLGGKRQQAGESASELYENVYFALIDKGSNMDKAVCALTHATACQLTDAWGQVVGMKERLEMAAFISDRTDNLKKQLIRYRQLRDRMLSMSSTISSRQMAHVMRKITQVNEALCDVETVARDGFLTATGYAKTLLPKRKEPLRYAKYSFDPLFDISTYPLIFHLFILSVTEGGLRALMRMRGFERRCVGPISYYYHPGSPHKRADGKVEVDPLPVVFCHGIGIGLIAYLGLVDELLALGRPVFLPEIPYVTGFRAWMTPSSILPPHEVASSLTAMLYECGYSEATFTGHSYGTSWLSYMCKLAPDAVSAVIFLDPVCFCLHVPYLTKQFVYHRADPGSISYMVRTDVNVNWTIQRGFPWAYVELFTEQLLVPTAVFLSEKDALVPSSHVEKYLKSKGAPKKYHPHADANHYEGKAVSITMFRDMGHGDWIDDSSMTHAIAQSIDVLGKRRSAL